MDAAWKPGSYSILSSLTHPNPRKYQRHDVLKPQTLQLRGFMDAQNSDLIALELLHRHCNS